MVEKTKRHIENYKKQDIFADATQAREGIETSSSLSFGDGEIDATQAREGIETKIVKRTASSISMQLKPVRALKPH